MALVNRKPISDDEAAAVLLKRRSARENFANFCEYLSPDEPPAKHHMVLCNALDEVAVGDNDRLMVFMPPGSAKSTYSSRKFPAYYLGKYPNKSIICGSYGENLATGFGRDVRNIVLSGEYGNLFDTRLSEDSRAKGEWATRDGGSYYAVGVGSGVTGRRSDLNLIDDPIKGKKDADSELIRDDIWQWYLSDFTSRMKLNIPTAQIIIQCMTGDTLVLMSNGYEKPLSEVCVGDRVATYDNGSLSSSKILNWSNNGHDSVYKITMSSGKIVRANERHPFLIDEAGELKWTRLKSLKLGQKIVTKKDNGGSGKEKNAKRLDVRILQNAEASVTNITTNGRGLLGIVQNLITLTREEIQNLSIAMASLLMNITCYLRNKTVNVLFVDCLQKYQVALNTGERCSVLTTTMNPISRVGFSVMTAISRLREETPLKFLSLQSHISSFTTDEIISIKRDGIEDVFDIQVERTENFIANGLVSHNTRWHEDDLSGRILPDDWNGESGTFIGFDGKPWKVICLPAEAEENDLLGRKKGDWLWPEGVSIEKWEEIKSIQTSKDVRNWSSLYQQKPQPDSGVFFKRDWFKRFDLGDEPPITTYGASDYAVSDGKGDFTEQGVGGFDTDFDLWFTDWWSGQTTADVWIDEQIRLARTHKVYHWLAEVGVIRRSVEPFLMKRKTEMIRKGKGQFFTMHWMNHIGDKAANARAFQALASEGKVHIPRTEWGDALIDQLVKFIPNTNFKDDKVDVCGMFGRILDQAFAPMEVSIEHEIEKDSYGFDEELVNSWKIQ